MPNANAIANVFKLIEENDIKFVLLRFTDIKGKEHGVSIPVSLVDEDMFEDGKMFDGSSVEGWKTINKADMLLMPIAETAVVDPFAQIPTLSIRCSVYEPSLSFESLNGTFASPNNTSGTLTLPPKDFE